MTTTFLGQFSRKAELLPLQTDYIDFGFIHCIDEAADLEKVQKSGVIDHILHLREQGVVRHVGLSSHTPELVSKVLDLRLLDMLMFSINPGYDYQQGDYGIGSVDDRMSLYRRCEKEGVAISVMKAFSDGRLLNGRTSPFKVCGYTSPLCIQRLPFGLLWYLGKYADGSLPSSIRNGMMLYTHCHRDSPYGCRDAASPCCLNRIQMPGLCTGFPDYYRG